VGEWLSERIIITPEFKVPKGGNSCQSKARDIGNSEDTA